MLSAMTASTGGCATCIHPSVAAARVKLCATVNAVMVFTNIHLFRTSRISAKTNNR